MKSFLSNLLVFVLDITQTFIVAFACFLLIYGFIIQPHRVTGESMMTTLQDGELILTNKIIYRTRQPERGDVITFKSPTDPKKDFIKRIIALPNERIEITKNQIKIYNKQFPDGFILQEPYLSKNQVTEPSNFLREGVAKELAIDEYIVMGDNRQNSYDSRAWGPLKKDAIIGKAWIVYWPLNRLGFSPTGN